MLLSHRVVLKLCQLHLCGLKFVLQLCLLLLQLDNRLLKRVRLAIQCISRAFNSVLEGRNQLVLLQVFFHLPVDARVQLLSLLFKVLHLLFESCVPGVFKLRDTLLKISVQAFQVVGHLRLHVDFVLHLRRVVLLVLLQFATLGLQHLDLLILVSGLFPEAYFELFLECSKSAISPLLFFRDPQLRLLLFNLIELLQLGELLFAALAGLDKLELVGLLLLPHLLFER